MRLFVLFLIVALSRAQDACQLDSNNVTTVCASCTNSTLGCSQCASRSRYSPWRVLTNYNTTYNHCLTCDAALNCSSQYACGPGGGRGNALPGCQCRRGEFSTVVNLTSLDSSGSTVTTAYKGACTSCMAAFNCTNCDSNGCLGCKRGELRTLRGRWDNHDAYICIACQSIDANCAQCWTSGSKAGTCKTCKQGFFVNATGHCDACSAGCAQCASAMQCTRCTNRLDVLVNGTCIGCATTTGDANCALCSADGLTCTRCKEGYVKDPADGKCKACSILVPNCAQCGFNATGAPVCRHCSAGWRLDFATRACVACDASCSSCDRIGCTSCPSGSFMNVTTTGAGRHRRITARSCVLCSTRFTGCIKCTPRRCLQ